MRTLSVIESIPRIGLITIVLPIVVVILRSTRVVDCGRNVANILVTVIPVLELVFWRRLPFATSSVLVRFVSEGVASDVHSTCTIPTTYMCDTSVFVEV